jgi:hypothetical protein
MKKIIITAGLALSLIATPALANCPSGVCAVEINCTTGEVTYTDAPPRVDTPAPVIPEPVAPTHTVVIQTANSSIGTSGSYEQVQQLVQQVITAPQAPQIDPCADGGCNKVIVNATTGQVDVLPLSPTDIQQRAIDQYMNYARQLEMAIAAKDVTIQPYVAPTLPTYTQPVIETVTAPVVSALTVSPIVTDKLSDVIWVIKNQITYIKKEMAKILIRTKGKK